MMTRLPALLALAALPLAACTTPAPAADPLTGTSWSPVAVAGTPAPEGVEAFIDFGEEGSATGLGGCNRFFGEYVVAGEALTMGPFGASRMFCEGAPMELEDAFLPALEQVRSFRLDGERLELLGEDGAVVIELTARQAG